MTRTHVTTILAILLAGAALSGTPQGGQVAPRPSPETAAVLNQYCVACHNQRSMTANFSMDQLDPQKVQQNPAAWEKVVRKLRTGTMPPP
ncbi:MAG TPA: c-type cytochrome domain-containing protein, partial [Terriglobia bacterium]|nr:c-type cytochrome domain-containing protein [Terriglobia bacterium]